MVMLDGDSGFKPIVQLLTTMACRCSVMTCSTTLMHCHFCASKREPLVLAALRAAVTARQPRPGLIHHSDRGGQYAGGDYRRTLVRASVQQSMSRADNCYDNAFMESCFGTIKAELEMTTYQNRHIARKEIADYIRYYNTRRRHSSLEYLSPEQFEATSAAASEINLSYGPPSRRCLCTKPRLTSAARSDETPLGSNNGEPKGTEENRHRYLKCRRGMTEAGIGG